MAKYLTNKKTQAALEDLIKQAEKQLILVCPYVKLTNHWLTLIKASAEKGVRVKIVCRNGEVKPEEIEVLKSIKNAEVKFIDALHAKCYFNEKEMIITSFNLLESSEKNWEMGILISRVDDKDIFEPAMEDIRIIFNGSESISKIKKAINPVFKLVNQPIKEKAETEFKYSSKGGYCIRCENNIKFNVEKPLCRDCFEIWSGWEDDEYPENYCHFTGEESEGDTCFARPILSKNWKKAKAMYGI